MDKAKAYISPKNSKAILTVGLNYINHKGGIGGVIETYSKFFFPFKFISTYRPQKRKIFIYPYFILAIFKLFWKLICDKDIRVVHIHGAAKGSLIRKYCVFWISKKIFSKKVIYHSHGSELEKFYLNSNKIIKRWMNKFFNQTDLIICLSNKWLNFFYSTFGVDNVKVLENIVERKEVSNKNLKILANNPIKFLFLGAIGKRKGIFDLLDTIRDNKIDLVGKLKLYIGGDGQIEKLLNYINYEELKDIIEFVGWVTGKQKEDLFAECDIYILPSYNEGLPLSILEAMSYKMPIISTPVGGTPEIVEDGQNGILIEPGNKNEILNALNFFIQKPGTIALFGNKSYNMVEPYYSDFVIPKLNSFYNELLK
ncbi:Glycosyltransferase involved in cell wall bisynthesis [bacterium A37T11]|nr:Glycosyltransferase involved in cell wall bisynthesis [bacterium A37T11]